MSDKTSIPDLLDVLERLCQDYQAMKYVLDNYGPEKWRSLTRERKQQSRFLDQVSRLFDETKKELQSGQPDDVVFASLVEALNRITLL